MEPKEYKTMIYFDNYGNIKFDTKKEEEKPTAESLRAAAKVLEEKAKELDKPKLTRNQLAALDYAYKMGACAIKDPSVDLNNNKVEHVSCYGSNLGEVTDTEKVDFVTSSYVGHTYENSRYYLTLYVVKDEFDCLEVYVKYPKS